MVAFARAWDRFAGARRARRASPAELAVLEDHLTASIAAEARPGTGLLGAAIAEHQATARARREREARATEQPALPPIPAEWLRTRRARPDVDSEREPA